MAGRYIMTARRKAALRKAQLVSARKRRKGSRKDRKIAKYGANRKTATLKQRAARSNRTANRIAVGYLAVRFVGPSVINAAYLRNANSKIAYNGEYVTKKGLRYTEQGGARFLRVKPTQRGARRRNRIDFIKQNGVGALAGAYVGMKRQQRTQRRNVRNAVRYGTTTMTWGATNQQLALPRGRR